ncbi:MAG: VWA domain-containing protein [Clostridiales bacterium]|nr:VWA domain-containing protein [Clostridiales bacterium]
MDVKEVAIKEMLIVTDGQSNVGVDPQIAAKDAFNQGIIVNTIGIVNEDTKNEDSLVEIVKIAEAGGGIYEYTYIDNLHQTLQSVTYRTVNKTLKETVNRQLKELIGEDMDNMTPDSRGKFLQYVDKFTDEVLLQCCILLDVSGSMASKIMVARHSILDLVDSFKTRKGRVDLAVIVYPGSNGKDYELIHGFGDYINNLEKKLYDVKTRGATPTGPAIYHGIEIIKAGRDILELEEVTI